MDAGDLSELLGLLYEGLAFPERWPDFLAKLRRRVHSSTAGIILSDSSGEPRPRMQFLIGAPREALVEYSAYYGAKNPAIPKITQMARRNGSWCGDARCLVNEAAYKKSEYYNGWGRKYGSFYSINGSVADSGQRLTTLCTMRPERRGPFDKEAVELVRLLLPHLRRAFNIHQKMETLRAEAEGSDAALDRLDAAVIALDGQGRVLRMNRRAESLLKRGDCLVMRQGRLVAADSRQAAQLDEMIASAALTGAGLVTDSGSAMRLHGRDSPSPLTVTVIPFHSSHVLTEAHPCALVFINDPAEHPASRATLLLTLYGLTPAECRLADLLLEEMDLYRAADRLGVTANTARFMLKTIFAKTGTHRQSELVRLMLSLLGEVRR